jgi:hypothetical protein
VIQLIGNKAEFHLLSLRNRDSNRFFNSCPFVNWPRPYTRFFQFCGSGLLPNRAMMWLTTQSLTWKFRCLTVSSFSSFEYPPLTVPHPVQRVPVATHPAIHSFIDSSTQKEPTCASAPWAGSAVERK